MVALVLLVAVAQSALRTPSSARADAPSTTTTTPTAPPAPLERFRAEIALMPFHREQQIEGPARDDRVARDSGLSTLASFTFAPVRWLEAGLYLAFDAGSSRRVTYARVGPDGTAPEAALVEGGFWELWAGIVVRGRLGPAFAELGWSPLVLRDDDTRTDLANESGETDGLFMARAFLPFMASVGAEIPLLSSPRLVATFRLQFRIRYLATRGGESLEGDQLFGQMHLWPYAGVGWRF